jgi:signal transduction histidine kinase
MRRGALRLRLLAAGAVSIVLALALLGVGLFFLFERHAERRLALELESQLRQLISGIERNPAGVLQLTRPLAEPRFLEPLSGLYWQVSPEPSGPALRSRSMWDAALTLPHDAMGDGIVHRHEIEGPNHETLFAVERTVVLPKTLGGGVVRAIVAVDRSELTSAGWAFISDLIPFLSGLTVFLLAAGWIQVTIGLRPLDIVRTRLADVRAGRRTQLGEGLPDEVRPLATEVDHLLVAQEDAIRRARARAADLAHALLTPLTVLQGDAEELRAKGENQIADEIAGVADGMRLHVERELVQSRAGRRVSAGTSQPILPVVQGIVGVLHRLPAGRSLDFEVGIASEVCVAVDQVDLSEMLGNLGENATKWARSRVSFTTTQAAAFATVVVQDDGPGIPQDAIDTVLRRGGRLAHSPSGNGLGLAIVEDLAGAYGGSVRLGRSDLGGLRAEIRLPIGRVLPTEAIESTKGEDPGTRNAVKAGGPR